MIERALGEDDLSALENAMYGRNYARYWHGYLVVLRPLLMLGSLEMIRYLSMFALFLLLAIVFYLFSRQLGLFAGLSLLICFLATWFLFVPMSIQYPPVYFVLFIQLILLLKQYPTGGKFGFLPLFFTAGMVTSYVDLLTTPLLTLGIPLLILLCLEAKDGRCAGTLWKHLILLSIAWAVGYGLFWASKWLLGSLVLKTNILADAAEAVEVRLQGVDPNVGTESYSALSSILENLKMLLPFFPLSLVKAGVFALVCISLFSGTFYLSGSLRSLPRIPLSRLLPLAAVCLYPFLWYSVLQNHSTIHAFFTCKILAIPIFGAFLIPALALGGRGAPSRFSGPKSPASPLQGEKKGL